LSAASKVLFRSKAMPSAVPMRLVLASANEKKLVEIRALLKDLPVTVISLKQYPGIRGVEEDGTTFSENAVKKALDYAQQTGELTLAEDSGICCDALEGAPGIFSARFAGPEQNDERNNEKLLNILEKVPDNCRGAHYTSALALARPGTLIGVVEGHVYGAIIKKPAGKNGFGYDPLFYYPAFDATFGEVSAEMKNRVSHRAQAFKKFHSLLAGYLKSGRAESSC